MSFLSVLKSIGSVIVKGEAIAVPFEPLISAVPGGAAFNAILNAVISTEQIFANVTTSMATSDAKKTVATAIVNATSPTTVEPGTLSTTINQVVAGLNTLQSASVGVAPPAAAEAVLTIKG